MDRDKLIELIEKGHEIELKYYPIDNYTEAILNIESLADYLIANGIGDITAEKHRADVAEEALRELIAEMYKNGIRPICNQEINKIRASRSPNCGTGR